MSLILFRGIISTPIVGNAEFQSLRVSSIIGVRLELEGAIILPLAPNKLNFEAGWSRHTASKWSIIHFMSSGETCALIEQNRIVVRYKICLDKWAIITGLFWLFGGLVVTSAGILSSSSLISIMYFYVENLAGWLCFFSIGAVITIIRFRWLLISCMKQASKV